MFRSIRWRITVSFALLSLLALLVLGAYLSGVLRQTYIDRLEAQLVSEARLLGDVLVPALGAEGTPADLDDRARHWSDLLDARVTIVAVDGTVLGESHEDRTQMGNHANRPEITGALNEGQGSSTRFSSTIGQEMMYTALPITTGGQTLGVVRLAMPLETVDANVARVQGILTTATLIIMALTVLLAAFVSYRTTRPVRKLTEAVRQMTAGPLIDSPVAASRDEVGELTQAFNAMSVQLGEQIRTLQTEGAKLSGVLQKMTDGVLIVGQDGRVQLINPAAERMFAVESSAALDNSLVQVVQHHLPVEMWQRCQETGESQSVEFELPTTKRWLAGSAVPLGPHLPGSTLLLFQDVSRQRQTERLRRDFISNVSHELRTPLAALKALTETLQDGALNDPPAAQRFLSQMEIEVDSLNLMVSELLELSRIESHRVPLKLQPTRPVDLVEAAFERLALQAERSQLRLSDACPPELPPVLADEGRVQQVLVNLIHNAIKFTPPGGQIVVGAKRQDEVVRFCVQDTGIGIAPDELARIFERFYKVDRSRATSGTGLGLAIVRHLVKAHGGTVWAESEPGRGSSFYFTLPLA